MLWPFSYTMHSPCSHQLTGDVARHSVVVPQWHTYRMVGQHVFVHCENHQPTDWPVPHGNFDASKSRHWSHCGDHCRMSRSHTHCGLTAPTSGRKHGGSIFESVEHNCSILQLYLQIRRHPWSCCSPECKVGRQHRSHLSHHASPFVWQSYLRLVQMRHTLEHGLLSASGQVYYRSTPMQQSTTSSSTCCLRVFYHATTSQWFHDQAGTSRRVHLQQ